MYFIRPVFPYPERSAVSYVTESHNNSLVPWNALKSFFS
jgi:hypothetical protein